MEDLPKSKGFLVEHLHEVVEDLVLNTHSLLLLLDVLKGHLIVLVKELFELLVLDKSIFVRVDLLEKFQELLSLERDSKERWHLSNDVLYGQEADPFVHLAEGLLGSADHLEFHLYGAEHLTPLDFLTHALGLLVSLALAHQCSPACGSILVVEDIIVCVSGPELFHELALRDVTLLVFIQLLKEHLDLLVGKFDLEPDECSLKFLYGDGLAAVFIN